MAERGHGPGGDSKRPSPGRDPAAGPLGQLPDLRRPRRADPARGAPPYPRHPRRLPGRQRPEGDRGRRGGVRRSAAFLAGTAAHGLELDDGYRAGSVHPGSVVVPAALAASARTPRGVSLMTNSLIRISAEPRMRSGCSGSTSPTTVQTLVVPISIDAKTPPFMAGPPFPPPHASSDARGSFDCLRRSSDALESARSS
ncbi:MAG: MmgE/PrpD family protein [Proteobacteria bacterium]|nr:MmgE/PrpD family protein [Pseudomonadota bacterium]